MWPLLPNSASRQQLQLACDAGHTHWPGSRRSELTIEMPRPFLRQGLFRSLTLIQSWLPEVSSLLPSTLAEQ